jgi:hypothetical protein
MVAIIEVAALAVLALAFYVWFRGTNISKAHRRHGFHPGQQGNQVGGYHAPGWGMPRLTPPPAALHDIELRPRRRWWFARRGG